MNSIFYSSLAGIFGAMAGMFGKLMSGNSTNHSELTLMDEIMAFELISLFYRLRFVALNVTCSVLMWHCFVKSLATTSQTSALTAQIVNTAVNFCLSAVLGHFVFNETSLTPEWLVGTVILLTGTGLIMADR